MPIEFSKIEFSNMERKGLRGNLLVQGLSGSPCAKKVDGLLLATCQQILSSKILFVTNNARLHRFCGRKGANSSISDFQLYS